MSEHEVELTSEERMLLADRVLGGASPSMLMVRAVEAIIAARLADAEARAEAAEAKAQKWRRKCAEMAAARLRGDQ